MQKTYELKARHTKLKAQHEQPKTVLKAKKRLPCSKPVCPLK